MGESGRTVVSDDLVEDVFELGLGELGNEHFESIDSVESATEKAVKRRRAEERLEVLRLREELGEYDLDFGEEL